MRIYTICSASSFVFLISCTTFAAVTVEHSELGFSLRLPDDFQRVTEEEQSNDFVRVYRQSHSDEPIAVIIAIERLHGVLPRLKMAEAPANPNVQLSTERWSGFDVLVARVTEAINGNPGVVLNAQVPLKPEAIQLKVMGPLSQELHLRELLRDTLATLEGSTNWLTTEDRSQRLGEGARRMGVTVTISVFIAVALITVAKKLWRPT